MNIREVLESCIFISLALRRVLMLVLKKRWWSEGIHISVEAAIQTVDMPSFNLHAGEWDERDSDLPAQLWEQDSTNCIPLCLIPLIKCPPRMLMSLELFRTTDFTVYTFLSLCQFLKMPFEYSLCCLKT